MTTMNLLKPGVFPYPHLMIPSLMYHRLNGGIPYNNGVVHFMHTDKSVDLGRIFSHNANSAVGSCTSPGYISRQEPNCDHLRFVVADVDEEYFRMKGRNLSTNSESTNAVKRARIDLTAAECMGSGGSSGGSRQQTTVIGSFSSGGDSSSGRQQTFGSGQQQTNATGHYYTSGSSSSSSGQQTMPFGRYETITGASATGSDAMDLSIEGQLPPISKYGVGSGSATTAVNAATEQLPSILNSGDDSGSAAAAATTTAVNFAATTSGVVATRTSAATSAEDADEAEMDRMWEKDKRFVMSPGEIQAVGSLTTNLPWKK
jgi:hypothetical protein